MGVRSTVNETRSGKGTTSAREISYNEELGYIWCEDERKNV